MKTSDPADKLAKICSLLASPEAGDRANAALLATQHLAKMGLTWDELIRSKSVAISPQTQTKPPSDVSSHVNVCEYILEVHPGYLNTRAKEFLENMVSKWRYRRMTGPQQAYLSDVVARCKHLCNRDGYEWPSIFANAG